MSRLQRFDVQRFDVQRFDRRRALVAMGLGTAGLLLGPRAARALARVRRRDLEELARQLGAESRESALDVAARAIAGGADRGTVLGAVFLAALRDVRPRPHGILHTVMMVESAFQLGDAALKDASAQEPWLPVLFTVDDLERALEEDRREFDDWKMPPRPDARPRGAEAARRELVAAMEAWDPERADRAVVALLPHARREELLELLWPWAARCSTYVGHKAIYVAQIARVLDRIGWQHAEPALRSIVRTLLWQRDTELFERSRERTGALPETWREGPARPAESARLLSELRSRSPDAARELAIEALRSGLGAAPVWDALRLFASEVFQRRPGRSARAGRTALLPVHVLTVTNALGHAWRSTRAEETRRLLMLQAVCLATSVRDVLEGSVSLSMEGPGLETLGDTAPADEAESLDAVLESGSPARARVFLDSDPAHAEAYGARLRQSLGRRALEHHQHKYAAAMLEESGLVHPRWRSRILAPALDYLAHPEDGETELYRRSAHALDRAGVG